MSFTLAAPNAVHYNAASVKQVLADPCMYCRMFSLSFKRSSQVDVPSFSGSFGILPSHVASLAVLKPGVVTVYEDDGATKKFFVSSG